MGNIVIGILFVLGGASGQMALRGTDSSGALIVVGALMAIYGCYETFVKKA